VAAALLSFLKEIGGTQIWTEKDLSSALTISSSRAKEATAVLQLQGYIEPAGHAGKWRVSEQGQIVSGAKSPRFSRKSIEGALAGLRDPLRQLTAMRMPLTKLSRLLRSETFWAMQHVFRRRMWEFALYRKRTTRPSRPLKSTLPSSTS
jgi:hypothetical protein